MCRQTQMKSSQFTVQGSFAKIQTRISIKKNKKMNDSLGRLGAEKKTRERRERVRRKLTQKLNKQSLKGKQMLEIRNVFRKIIYCG